MMAAAGAGVLGLTGLRSLKGLYQKKTIPGGINSQSFLRGHLLRKSKFPAISEQKEIPVVVVGGGMSGLTAGYNFLKKDFQEFTILELEDYVGGNSASGENKVSSYPLGAHYVPLLSSESHLAKEFFKELGVIKETGEDGEKYNEFYICSDPSERLMIEGRWQEGIIPSLNISEEERANIEDFLSHVEKLKKARGEDGKRAFAIPIDLSSKDPRFRDLDTISFKEYLNKNNFTSKPLLWYLNYCTQDDYGAKVEEVSAWAGLHYFASRDGKAKGLESDETLTWPEGNGWIVKQLKKKLEKNIRTGQIVFNIESRAYKTYLDVFDFRLKKSIRYLTKKVIYSAPRFTALKVIKEWRESPPAWSKDLVYNPWMVANITMSTKPDNMQVPLSWDNVNYNGKSLGYVVATHQSLKTNREETVLTQYWPLTERSPMKSRVWALGRSHQEWCEDVVRELDYMHPGIEKFIENIDIQLWGHAMVSPAKNYIWGETRKKLNKNFHHIHFAHSDMSGISIFEEAHYQGMLASERVLHELGKI